MCSSDLPPVRSTRSTGSSPSCDVSKARAQLVTETPLPPLTDQQTVTIANPSRKERPRVAPKRGPGMNDIRALGEAVSALYGRAVTISR